MGMELVKWGSLKQYIKQNNADKVKIPDNDVAHIMRNIIKAVTYIHERGIIHRDLKTANILIDDINDLSSIKIIDFGFGERNQLTTKIFDE